MNFSAFDVLVVPVLRGTFGACLAGVAIFALKGLVDALIVGLGRTSPSSAAASDAARDPLNRSRQTLTHGIR